MKTPIEDQIVSPSGSTVSHTTQEFEELKNQNAELRNEVAILSKKQELSVPANSIATHFFNPAVWTQMKGMAETFAKSGALGRNENSATLIIKIQAGYEMGMKPIEAIKSFYFVNGVLSIFGAAVTRRLREHGWKIEYKDEKDKCTATVSKGDESYTDSITFEDAQKSKWTHGPSGLKAGWYEGANRKLKLRYGALSLIVKTYLSEVLGSAVDIAEIAQDYAPLINGDKKELPPAANDEKPITDNLALFGELKRLDKAGKIDNKTINGELGDLTVREGKELLAAILGKK